jgi:hypothetical protein
MHTYGKYNENVSGKKEQMKEPPNTQQSTYRVERCSNLVANESNKTPFHLQDQRSLMSFMAHQAVVYKKNGSTNHNDSKKC